MQRLLFALTALVLAGCDSKAGKPPPALDACNLVLGDWTVRECHHLVLDGGKTFETPGGAVLTIKRDGNDLLVGPPETATRVTPTEHTDTRCAGAGLSLVIGGPKELLVERTEADFKSNCTFTR